HRQDSHPPKDSSRVRDSFETAPQGLPRGGSITCSYLGQGQREIVLVVVRARLGGPLKNADGLSDAAEMRIHIAEQREVSVVILSRRGDVSEHLAGASVISELKVRRSQIVSGIDRAGTGPH